MFSVRQIKKQAKELLSKNIILHIGVITALFTCVTAISLLSASVLTLINGLVSVAVFYTMQAFFICFGMVMTVPIIYGFCVFECNAVDSQELDIKDLFCAFSSLDVFNRSYFLAFALLWRVGVCFFPAIFFYLEIMLYRISKSSFFIPVSLFGFDITYTFMCVLLMFFIITGLAVFSRFFTAIYISVTNEDIPVSKCFSLASVYNHGYKKKLLIITASFVPLIVLSLITMGILFVLYAAPLMLTTYFNFAKNCYDFGKNQ